MTYKTFLQFTTNFNEYTYYYDNNYVDGFISNEQFDKFLKGIIKEVKEVKTFRNVEKFKEHIDLGIMINVKEEDTDEFVKYIKQNLNIFEKHLSIVGLLTFTNFDEYQHIIKHLK